MLEYYEVSPLPEVCIQCMTNGDEEDCYNCDFALERWHMTPESELRLKSLIEKKAENHNNKHE